MEDHTLGNILCNLLVNFYDLKTIGYFAPLHEIFFQVDSDSSGIFMNLKSTTEGQEAINITCSHKDS